MIDAQHGVVLELDELNCAQAVRRHGRAHFVMEQRDERLDVELIPSWRPNATPLA